MKFKALILVADVPNANNRIYPRAVCEKIVEQTRHKIEGGSGLMGRMVGDLTQATALPRLQDMTHVVTGIEMTEEGKVFVEFEPLVMKIQGKTPSKDVESGPGFHLQKLLLEAPEQVVLRTYGEGNLRDRGEYKEVESGYILTSVDVTLRSIAAKFEGVPEDSPKLLDK